MAEPETIHGMNATLADNIERLQERAAADAKQAPLADRMAEAITGFTGSMTFVVIHLVAYGCWILINLGVVPGVGKFDPSFVMLASEASVEAIFLSTFVLISQNRMAALANRRADLALHVTLLTEHELTRLAGQIARIAEHLGVKEDDPELHEVRQDVQAERVLDAIEEAENSRG